MSSWRPTFLSATPKSRKLGVALKKFCALFARTKLATHLFGNPPHAPASFNLSCVFFFISRVVFVGTYYFSFLFFLSFFYKFSLRYQLTPSEPTSSDSPSCPPSLPTSQSRPCLPRTRPRQPRKQALKRIRKQDLGLIARGMSPIFDSNSIRSKCDKSMQTRRNVTNATV